MKVLLKILIFFCISGINLIAQNGNMQWKFLTENSNQKIWYDASSLDSLPAVKINIWILQMNKQPLEFKEVPEKIYRSQIQYALDLKSDRYGILKVVYFGINNKEIYNFNYHIEDYPDSIKYTYPISDISFLKILKEKITKIETKETSNTQ